MSALKYNVTESRNKSTIIQLKNHAQAQSSSKKLMSESRKLNAII